MICSYILSILSIVKNSINSFCGKRERQYLYERKKLIMDKALETKLVYNYKIELTTLKDVKEFVKIATKLEGKLSLKSGAKLTVNAKSLLGVLLAQHLNWNDLTLTSDRDRYFDFKKFIVDGTN